MGSKNNQDKIPFKIIRKRRIRSRITSYKEKKKMLEEHIVHFKNEPYNIKK